MSPLRTEVFEPSGFAPREARLFAAPAGLHLEPSAWRVLVATQADALIIGDRYAITQVLNHVWWTLHKPIFWIDSRRLCWLPEACESTLILEHAHELKMSDQGRFLDWLSAGSQSPRVIATASRPLSPLVEAGAFSRSLYDRIAAVHLTAA
jgi:hypothetical protein